MRLMMGILAGQPFTSRLTGDASLNRRPMERVMEPLKAMGAEIQELRASQSERVIKVEGRPLNGIEYALPVASAQVKSAVLLAGLYARGNTRVLESIPSRDHTEIMMRHCGVNLRRDQAGIALEAPLELHPMDLAIPGDISSAAFFLVGACLGRSSQVHLTGVGVNPTRTGILEVLASMGASVQQLNPRQAGGEAVADLQVHSGPLRGTRIAGALIPRLIDEIPILSVAAAAAEGMTEIRDAEELRVKETDRIQAIDEEFRKLSIKIKSLKDGLQIQGPSSFRAGTFSSHGDHRIAMSLAIAATQAEQASLIQDVECVQTSYPEFFAHLGSLGAKVE
jgi:3-phosphoshikimate 1-carboxyvinyltransferase